MSEPPISAVPASAEGVITRPSPFPLPETIARLEQAILARGLTLFAYIDHAAEARKVGLSMQAAHVLIFGNPRGGTPLMVASPLLALDLPLKVLVWQTADMRVWVSTTTVDDLARRYSLPPDLAANLAIGSQVIGQALTA